MIKNYSFHLELDKNALKENEVFWNQARQMNLLWDAMLEFRKSFLDNLAPLYEDKIANKESLKEAWKGFDKALYQIGSEDRFKDALNWLAREAVFESFKNAHKRALKTGGELRFKGKRIAGISFYHRFTGGGIDTVKAFSSRSKKLSLDPLDDKFYDDNSNQNRKARTSKGIFGIGKNDEALPISVLFHRPLPSGKIKTVRLVGELNEISREWTWKIVFAVESDAIPEMNKFAPLAALDLNWRHIDDYLRIGYLKDTAGNSFEVRLPLEEKPNRKARGLLRIINRNLAKSGQPPMEMKDLIPHTLKGLIEWDEKIGSKQQAAKDCAKMMFLAEKEKTGEISAPAEHFLTFFQKIGRRGMLKLLWELTTLEARSDADDRIIETLEKWKSEDYQLRLASHKTRRRLQNKRKKLYENLALWLKKTYAHLAWEGDLSLKEMAESAPKISLNSKDIAIKLGNKYRQFAGLSVLRNKLKEHNFNKNWLIGIKSANSTKICHLCGNECEVTAKILVQCSKGHVVDVDANSVNNMLNKCPDDLIISEKKESFQIPEHLKSYIVAVVKF